MLRLIAQIIRTVALHALLALVTVSLMGFTMLQEVYMLIKAYWITSPARVHCTKLRTILTK
jgi:hypothetical protein